MQPSALWIEWISSAFFIFPGLMPRASALSFISVIVIRLCFTFVAGILFSFQFSFVELCPTPFSLLRNPNPGLNNPKLKLFMSVIFIEQFTQGGEKNLLKNPHFGRVSTDFLQVLCAYLLINPHSFRTFNARLHI